MKKLEQTWRWYGPDDSVSLADVRQAGATGVVTALHQMSPGEVWPIAAIRERVAAVEAAGLRWSVVESIPVHEDIKRASGDYRRYIDNYGASIRNLATCGVGVVTYNFMPVMDWVRTELAHELPDGSHALYFEKAAFAAFDLYLLARPGAEADYSEVERQAAKRHYAGLDERSKARLTEYIIAGLPGKTTEGADGLTDFRRILDTYADIDADTLRQNLVNFLLQIAPVAQEVGVKLAIHPDDPPLSPAGLAAHHEYRR